MNRLNSVRQNPGALLAMLLAWGGASGADSDPLPGIETVVVTGEQPGPQLWKATNHGHVLWIYGTVTPKPRDITWRSKQLIGVLDETKEIFNQQLQGTSWPVNVEVRPDSGSPLAWYRRGRRLEKMALEHAPPPLREVIPSELYLRYAQLRNKYLPKDERIESLRPAAAAARLYEAAIARAQLSSRAMIHDETHRLARKRRIEVSEITLEKHVDDETYEAIVTERLLLPASAELDCFAETIALLETEIPTITARANAWAVGDVKALKQLPSLRREVCDRTRYGAPRWAELEQEMTSLWLTQIDAAVMKHRTTLVLVDVAEIFEPDGLIPQLVQRGYQLEGPEITPVSSPAAAGEGEVGQR
jgi:TraB/PrgY/gumN family